MPQSPSKSPSSPKRSSNINTDHRKTTRSSALNSASTAFNDNIIIKDPSIVSVKNSRYPSNATAAYVHPASSILKDAPTLKPSSRGPISGGFKIPMSMDSMKAIKLSAVGPSAIQTNSGVGPNSPPSGSSMSAAASGGGGGGGSTVPIASTAASGPSTFSGVSSATQSPSAVAGKVMSPSEDQPGPSATTRQTEPGQARPEPDREVKVPMSTGIKIEFGLATAASLVFLGLWIFLMTANCYNHLELVFWVKTFSLVGAISGLFIALYCCFERNLSPRNGLTGCLFLTCLVVVISLNLIGAYLTIAKCICRCEKNALKDGKEDFWITILEVIGSALLIVVLIVASVSSQRA